MEQKLRQPGHSLLSLPAQNKKCPAPANTQLFTTTIIIRKLGKILIKTPIICRNRFRVRSSPRPRVSNDIKD